MTVASCDDLLDSWNAELNHPFVLCTLLARSRPTTIYDCRNRKRDTFVANCFYHLAISYRSRLPRTIRYFFFQYSFVGDGNIRSFRGHLIHVTLIAINAY